MKQKKLKYLIRLKQANVHIFEPFVWYIDFQHHCSAVRNPRLNAISFEEGAVLDIPNDA